MNIAVVAHVYYPEIWPEIAAYLRRWPRGSFSLYVTTPPDRYDQVRELVFRDFAATVIAAPNRGRDIAPFLQVLPQVIGHGCDLVCKVHTKKSPHWEHGDRWRKQLYKGTLGLKPNQVTAAFTEEPELGILAPAGHLISHRAWWEANRRSVMNMAGRLGPTDNLLPFRYATGSMFWARTDALAPLLKLGLTADDFPEETGQIDGTLAHAIERLFPLAARQAGYETCDTSLLLTIAMLGTNAATPWWWRELARLRHDLRLRTRAKAALSKIAQFAS